MQRSNSYRVLAKELLLPLADASRFFARKMDHNIAWSFSQEGEDMVLRRLLEGRTGGFYVDVGAHHPRRFSNTNYFYEQGWRGINIEPCPDGIRLFDKLRPRDINVLSGVSETQAELTYYQFDDPALNTFDKLLMQERETRTPFRVVRTTRVMVERLDAILRKSIPQKQTIDFMSIDVEGYDLQVLHSNDWNRFRPGFVLVEALDFELDKASKHPVQLFMNGVGYDLVAKTLNTLFYRDIR